jgi:hypothetical protein
MSEDRELTFGEKAVGLTFNPSNDPAVDHVKKKAAEFIDYMHSFRSGVTGERARMASLAITEAQVAQMWAVKALTWRD